eukprot:745643-Amphidinium_carterae.1
MSFNGLTSGNWGWWWLWWWSLPDTRMVSLIPVSFCCGMCLVDTVNGLLMLATYSWAEVDPMQKLIYNFAVTAMSSAMAVCISVLEVLQLVAEQTNANGTMWNIIRQVDMASIGENLQ